jgi:hypothetical protein
MYLKAPSIRRRPIPKTNSEIFNEIVRRISSNHELCLLIDLNFFSGHTSESYYIDLVTTAPIFIQTLQKLCTLSELQQQLRALYGKFEQILLSKIFLLTPCFDQQRPQTPPGTGVVMPIKRLHTIEPASEGVVLARRTCALLENYIQLIDAFYDNKVCHYYDCSRSTPSPEESVSDWFREDWVVISAGEASSSPVPLPDVSARETHRTHHIQLHKQGTTAGISFRNWLINRYLIDRESELPSPDKYIGFLDEYFLDKGVTFTPFRSFLLDYSNQKGYANRSAFITQMGLSSANFMMQMRRHQQIKQENLYNAKADKYVPIMAIETNIEIQPFAPIFMGRDDISKHPFTVFLTLACQVVHNGMDLEYTNGKFKMELVNNDQLDPSCTASYTRVIVEQMRKQLVGFVDLFIDHTNDQDAFTKQLDDEARLEAEKCRRAAAKPPASTPPGPGLLTRALAFRRRTSSSAAALPEKPVIPQEPPRLIFLNDKSTDESIICIKENFSKNFFPFLHKRTQVTLEHQLLNIHNLEDLKIWLVSLSESINRKQIRFSHIASGSSSSQQNSPEGILEIWLSYTERRLEEQKMFWGDNEDRDAISEC